MNSLFSEFDPPAAAGSPEPSEPPEADDSKLSRAERRRRREETARALTGPMTDALARRGRGDRDLYDGTREYRVVPIGDVIEDEQNPRTVFREVKELAENLKENDLNQPILCWVDRKGNLHLKDGARRLRAAKLAGWKTIPALIEYTEGKKLRQQVSANIHHEKMNVVDEAWAIKRMMREEKISTEQQLAKSLGKSVGWVNLRMQITRMTEEEQAAIKAGDLAYTEAIKRRKQGRDILTGEWILGSGVIGGTAGSPSSSTRFPRDVQSRQAGGASIQRTTPLRADQRDIDGKIENTKQEAPTPRALFGHFNDEHELAFRVSHRCGNHGRPAPQIGGVGCGACWEYIIRTDERLRVKTENIQKKD
jgi:ParB/RepB/Spo0J family partition protein